MMPSRVRSAYTASGEMTVYCWCQAEIIAVPRKVIMASKTGSCGRRGCTEEEHSNTERD